MSNDEAVRGKLCQLGETFLRLAKRYPYNFLAVVVGQTLGNGSNLRRMTSEAADKYHVRHRVIIICALGRFV
jgi:hypothetical protein